MLQLLALFMRVQVQELLIFKNRKDPKMQGCSRKAANFGVLFGADGLVQCA